MARKSSIILDEIEAFLIIERALWTKYFPALCDKTINRIRKTRISPWLAPNP
jgi:hypothetical protein